MKMLLLNRQILRTQFQFRRGSDEHCGGGIQFTVCNEGPYELLVVGDTIKSVFNATLHLIVHVEIHHVMSLDAVKSSVRAAHII
jgi:hypothetical protein